MKKIVAFDLDGTLTQHKSPLGAANREVLEKLSARYHLLMLGAGSCERIYRQMQEFPIEIIGNYGMQHSKIIDGRFQIVESLTTPVDREFVDNAVTMLRKEFGFEKFYGDNVEFHASGVITFPVLGTAAPLPEKLAYDPDRSKRRKVYARVCEVFAGYNVFIGGSSSFDITQGKFNKYYALEKFCADNGYTLDDAVYFGDDFGEGGNDSHVRLGGVDCVEISDYTTFPAKAEFLIS